MNPVWIFSVLIGGVDADYPDLHECVHIIPICKKTYICTVESLLITFIRTIFVDLNLKKMVLGMLFPGIY